MFGWLLAALNRRAATNYHEGVTFRCHNPVLVCPGAQLQGTILEIPQSHTNPFHRQIELALDAVQDRSDLKIIIAPTAAAASAIRTAMARTGRGLVNLEALTPGGLAFHILKAMDPVRARRTASRVALECVIVAALADQEDNPLARLFSRSVPALVRSISADRMAGRRSGWARQHANSGAQALYANLFELYESFLEEKALLDLAGVLDKATGRVEQFRNERHLGLVLVSAETPLVPEQAALLDSLSEGGLGQLVGDPGVDVPEHCAGHLLAGWRTVPIASTDPPPAPRVLQAATRREEVLMVLQDIRESGLSISEVELAVTDSSSYVPVIRSLGRRLGLPISCAGRDEHEVFVQFAATLLEWMHSPAESSVLAGMLRSGWLADAKEPFVLAATLDEFPITMSMLDRSGLRESLIEGAKRNWTDPARVAALLDYLRSFRTHRWPARLSPGSAMERLEKSVRALWGAERDVDRYWERLEELLSEFRDAPEVSLPAKWVASRMAAVLTEAAGSSRDAGSEIMVVPIEEAGFGPRAYVWILGLDDKAAARSESQDGTHFAGFEAVQENGASVLLRQRIEILRGRIGPNLTLSAPAFDVSDGRYLFPSSALMEHGGIQALLPQQRIPDLDRAEIHVAGGLIESFPGVADGGRALAARRSDQWTAWDGKLPPVPEGSQPDLRVSTSRLEMLAACPFRYWLSETLKVPVTPEPATDWLSASDLGLIVHDLFEQHTRNRAANQAGTGSEDEQAMLAHLRDALERQAVRSGSDRNAALEQRYEEWAQAVHQYFQRERALEPQRTPVHAEYPVHEPGDTDSRTIRIELPSGSISLSGRIDRIDETVDGTWVIVDYKTGSWKDFVPARLKSLDSKLQWALYSMAAARLSGKTVEKAEYVFTSRKGSGWVSAAAPPPEDVILDVLDLLLKRLQSGAFIQAAEKNGVCTWCDLKAVCGDLDERKSQLKTKFAAGDEDVEALFETWPQKP